MCGMLMPYNVENIMHVGLLGSKVIKGSFKVKGHLRSFKGHFIAMKPKLGIYFMDNMYERQIYIGE